MTCQPKLIPLPCGASGFGYTAQPLNKGQTRLQLMKGHGVSFPTISHGQFFYVTVHSPCGTCCETMQVVGVEEDELIVVRDATAPCECIPSNAKVVYSTDSKQTILAISREVGLNVAAPLQYDCEKNLLSINCEQFSMSDCGCGAGNAGGGSGTPGRPGRDGAPGKDGVSIVGVDVTESGALIVTLSDGTRVNAGVIPTVKGEQGEPGPRGVAGPKGDEGEPGPHMVSGVMSGDAMVFALSDGSTLRVEDARGPQGIQGPPGPNISSGRMEGDDLILEFENGATIRVQNVRGPQGPQGPAGRALVQAARLQGPFAVVVGPPGEQIRVEDSAGDDMEFTIGLDGAATISMVAAAAPGIRRFYQGDQVVGVMWWEGSTA